MFVGFVSLTGVSGGMAEFQAQDPVALLEGLPLPWDPPMAHRS